MKRMYYIMASLLFVFTCFLGSCDSEDESTLSKAVLTSAGTLNFEANGATEKIITVYADGDWVSEVPDWVTVTPATGTGTMDVTISVNDNMRDGAIDNPRKASLVFKGSTLASRAEVVISQNGDKYRDCPEYSLSELTALTDEAVVSVPGVTVTAVTTVGFVVTDALNQVNVYMLSTAAVSIGDKVSVKGTKFTDSKSLIYVECDEVNVDSKGGAVTYPTATDITDKVDTYTSASRDFVTVSGILNGTNVTVEGANNSVAITDAPENLNLASLNGHKVTVTGYFAGVAAPVVKVMAAAVKDRGVVEVIYFSDDFEWLQPWADNSGAGQTVENDGTGSAPQIYTAENGSGQLASEALVARGYGLEEIPGHAIYLQKNYLKFGKTDYQAGITLPALQNISANTKLKLSFDWAPMVGGSRKFDPVKLIVSVTNGNQVVELDPIGHSFVDTVDKLEWLHADVVIDGVTITKDTRISIKSDGWGDTKSTTGSSVYRRWFLDNIKLTKAN
ncbi:MAG: BACON domain-containing protein [Bacteroides sp.]|nr:BACON domain-containing protein [Bacteroides sp.]